MCGIVGFCKKKQVGEDNSILTKMREQLFHRGPDSGGKWSSASFPIWLGHRRLAIVDLSDAGSQPMHNENHSIWLVCNGEIYNYPTLRSRLEGLGHHFYSNSDSEVILHAYETWGDGVVEHLEGMFAFGLWDENKQRLLLARDRVGIKPLCYTETKEGIAFASEVSALLPLAQHEPEPLAMAYMMTLGYIPCPWSIWKNVFKLKPGQMLTWSASNGIRKRKYWEAPRHIEPQATASPEEWQELFHSVLNEHLLSDVPIGLFLSGGLDSSSVAAGLSALGQPVEALTVSFPESPNNEAPIAKATAEHLGFAHQDLPLNVGHVEMLIQHVSAAYDEPQGYSALLSMFLVSQEAAKKYKVVLAGDGGDEIFGGYTWYNNLKENFPKRSSWIRPLLRPFVKRNASSEIRKKAVAHFQQCSALHRHAWRLYPRFLPEEAEALLAPHNLAFNDKTMLDPLLRHFEPKLPLKRALQRVDLMNFCSDSILAKVDRASMAHSLEVRVPFLDRRVIERALQQPLQEREALESKPILRDYLKSRVPASVLNHPKQGFSLRVLHDFDWNKAITTIEQGYWVRQGYWSSNWHHLLAPGIPYQAARIWNLLILTYWADAWIA